MTAAKVQKTMKDNAVKFVDLRFTDTKGKEQHVTVPTAMVDAGFFKDGKMFDGSSIAGWKGINESDMVLMPDTDTAVMDPFSDEPTLIIRCDILEPNTMKGYERDPRSLAMRAEAYLKSTGIADTAYFGPENEFFIFDDVRWGSTISGSFCKVDSNEASWNTERVYEDGNMGHRPTVKGWLFPGAAGRCAARLALRHVSGPRRNGAGCRSASPRSGHGRPMRNRRRFRHAGEKGRRGADPEICDSECRPRLWQNRHLHAQADRR